MGSAFFITNVDRFTDLCGPFTYTLWLDQFQIDRLPNSRFSFISAQLKDIQIPFRFYDWSPAQLWIYTSTLDVLETANLEYYFENHKIYVRKILSVFHEEIQLIEINIFDPIREADK